MHSNHTSCHFASPMKISAILLMTLSSLGGCESNDPCVLRQAACLDVTLMGKKDPVFYRNLTIRVTDGKGAELGTASKAEVRATAAAATQDTVKFVLPDGFNALMDSPPAEAIEKLATDADKIARLKELRLTDPRAIIVNVEGTEVSGADMAQVKWNSKDDEACFSDEQWLMQRYYRVGKNESRAAYAVPVAGKLCKSLP